MSRIVFCILGVTAALLAGPAAAGPRQASPAASGIGQPARQAAQYAPRNVSSALPSGRQAIYAAAPKVYLLRGFMNVFSLGMDDLAARLQANGIAASVANHAEAEGIVARIVADYQAGDRNPIVLIGHSLGADATIFMAQALDRYNIPVALVVLFDGTGTHAVPRNVSTAINFTQRFDIGPGPDFRGTISNVDLRRDTNIDHVTIDKAPNLQAVVINDVLQVASAKTSAMSQPVMGQPVVNAARRNRT